MEEVEAMNAVLVEVDNEGPAYGEGRASTGRLGDNQIRDMAEMLEKTINTPQNCRFQGSNSKSCKTPQLR
jgi:hypothetical protein